MLNQKLSGNGQKSTDCAQIEIKNFVANHWFINCPVDDTFTFPGEPELKKMPLAKSQGAFF